MPAKDEPSHIPPGWSYNPGSWAQRLPIVGLAVIGFGIATYLAAFQYSQKFNLGWISDPWDPFFPGGTRKILTSQLSWVLWPFSDALLGALGYLGDALAGAIGGRQRWRTMPWIVIVFAILVGPLGLVSIGLVMAQPVLENAWCTLCTTTAVISLTMIGPALDEALASLQYMKRVLDTPGRSAWRAFWGLDTRPLPPGRGAGVAGSGAA